MRNGLNVTRLLVGGRPNNIGGTLRDSIQQGTAPNYNRGVVLDVIYNPEEVDKEQLKNSVSNPEVVDNMPADSLVVLLVGNTGTSPVPSIVYPFFQSHIRLPIHPGEHVFVVFEDPTGLGQSLGRWISRIHENREVEDVNYTHSDRRLLPSQLQQRTSQQGQTSDSTPSQAPGFPNGGNTADTRTLPQPNDSQNPYDEILRLSELTGLHTFEPVPRWTKRPGEFVFEGSNNSLIVLGRDRSGVVSGSSVDTTKFSGCVDVVCGRGRYPLRETDNQPNPTSTPTSALVVKNSRNNLETDKTPRRRNRTKNPNEGNPDFKRDAARVLVSANTKGDETFKIKHSINPAEGLKYPDNTLHPTQPAATTTNIGSSYIIGKADHVRLIARNDRIPTGEEIKGTVLVVKEGTTDRDLAFLFIDAEGRVQLDGNKVFLGKAVTADPTSTDHAEPYMKWSVYNTQINELKAQIKALSNQVRSITTAYELAFVGSVSVPFVPIASLAAVGPTVKTATITVSTAVNTAIDTIHPEDAKSEKIFGS